MAVSPGNLGGLCWHHKQADKSEKGGSVCPSAVAGVALLHSRGDLWLMPGKGGIGQRLHQVTSLDFWGMVKAPREH